MANKYKKRDVLLEKEIASLLRKYNIKQAIDILFPKMRWVFYVFFILTLVTTIAFILQEFIDFHLKPSTPFKLLMGISILSISNIIILVISLWIKGYIYLVRKLFFLRLFISILSGWLIFFSSEEFWQIEFDLNNSNYLLIEIGSILFIIFFFMMIEIRSLIGYKRVFDRVLTVIGMSLIISINIGIFYMPNVLVGILDNGELLFKNKEFNNEIMQPHMDSINNLELEQRQLSVLIKYLEYFKNKTNDLKYINSSSFNFNVNSTNKLNNETDTIESTNNTNIKAKPNPKNEYDKKKKKYSEIMNKIDNLNNDDTFDSKIIDSIFIFNPSLINRDAQAEKKDYIIRDTSKLTSKNIDNQISITDNAISDSYNKSQKKFLEIEKTILKKKESFNKTYTPKYIRENWMTKKHGSHNAILINGTKLNNNYIQYHPKLLIFQTFLAMFFGVFMQLLIQDKTVTESI